MSKRETPMTLWYWQQTGGTLIEEFLVVSRSPTNGPRLLDGLIILGEETVRLPIGSKPSLQGKDVVIVQAKNSRLGMYLMGQTLFSLELVKRHSPRSILSVALCAKDDALLRPLLESHQGCKVVVCPEDVAQLTFNLDLTQPQSDL